MSDNTAVETAARHLSRIRSDLDALGRAPFPGARLRPEDLWREVRDAGVTVRGELVPYLRAECELVLPALALSTAGHRLLLEEVEGHLRALDDLEQELLRVLRPTATLRATGTLAALRALGTLGLRYSEDVVLASLRELSDHEAQMLVDATTAYRVSLGEVSASSGG